MKTLLALSITFFILLSCKEEDEISKDVFGTYQITEIYLDPGDGSGDFTAVESDRIITLLSDSTFRANFSFCSPLTTETSGSSEGIYDTDHLIFSEDCGNSSSFKERRIDLSPTELIIWYPCFEGCAEKYIRIGL